MDPSRTWVPSRRADQTSSSNEFLSLIADPFTQEIQLDSVLASLGVSLGISLLFALLFCLLRPYNTVVYAPRIKHADEKHAPPPIGKGPFAWISPVIRTKEQALIEKVGLDAAIFIRFTKMCRNIFLVLTVIGCGILIPTSIVSGKKVYGTWDNISAFMKMTPQYMFGEVFWAFVACAYAFNVVICGFLWWNYRAVARLRRQYFESSEYQMSLHARTLMITDIPKELRTDEGVVKITDEIKKTRDPPRGAIARNVRDIPELIEEHEKLVRDLEGYLAKYMKNGELAAKRPMCKPSKKDKMHNKEAKVDAIDYLTSRIRALEIEIKEVRMSVDKRNAMPYGFASYPNIADAHKVAYASKKKGPHKTVINMAPKPNDLLWQNLPLSPKTRRWRTFMNNVWVTLLTLVWIVPNALFAVFLSNLSNLGRVWPAFQTQLSTNRVTWSIVQGVASPAITSLFYLFLPSIFRRLSINAGDLTKTSRERHVMHKLYAFFVFNNLIVFSLFATVWKYIADIVAARREGKNVLDAINNGDLFTHLMISLCQVSPYWVTWILQRNLGAAVDLSQVVNLAWGSFARKFLAPTPRQMIEWTAPPPLDYASYYNYFLFYTTISLCFGTLQPVILPVTALYFVVDSWLKKYLILYVFITKTESGGQFWRVLFNRFLFATFLSNIIVALLVKARGYSWTMLVAMIPLVIILIGFKIYCARAFDDEIHFFSRGKKGDRESVIGADDKENRRTDRVGVRFGHPALYKPLMTPMVHAKSQHLLAQVYRGRIEADTDGASVAGYSDTYSLHNMSRDKPGKKAAPGGGPAPFEFVHESDIDFENFKNRADFQDAGGDGDLYGRTSRPDTPSTFVGGAGYASHDRGRSSSRDSDRTAADVGVGVTYPTGYHQTPGLREYSPSPGPHGRMAMGRRSRVRRISYPSTDSSSQSSKFNPKTSSPHLSHSALYGISCSY
ncbi:DUF221-domain-containing protein [Aulographum hederae CBS 113979]|uniref:DUF221-domain-containing protein n=1 Tax=Aulographum hederae CBS 113979 TaxID=1176131 RepID=A0A6G1H1P4_9PEZI|nr:DUF221-domain-containing protein [Aulographum hederae CBS 113979]